MDKKKSAEKKMSHSAWLNLTNGILWATIIVTVQSQTPEMAKNSHFRRNYPYFYLKKTCLWRDHGRFQAGRRSMEGIDELKSCYAEYEREAGKARAAAKPWDGILGFGNKPSAHPCHDEFFEKVQQTVQMIADSVPAPETAAEAVEFILTAKAGYGGADIVWMVQASEGAVLKLIPFLEQKDASRLLEMYNRISPKRTRFPLQKKIAEALKAAAGQEKLRKP